MDDLRAERANIEAKLRAAEQESEKHLKDLVQKQSRKVAVSLLCP